MILTQLSGINFRNYKDFTLNDLPKITILYGPNGAGKTNLLEAMGYLAIGQSFRQAKNSEVIGGKADFFKLSGQVQNRWGKVNLEFAYRQDGKKLIKVNEIVQRKISSLLGNLLMVYFIPDDLALVKGGPANRRRYLDLQLIQTSTSYLADLHDYNQIIKQRNKLLELWRLQNSSLEELNVWTQQLIDVGSRIIYKRSRLIESLTPAIVEYHARLSGGKEKLSLKYLSLNQESSVPSQSEIKELFKRELAIKKTEELRRGITLAGPQRDEIIFQINGLDARVYGSQGQQRTLVLAMKMAEVIYFYHETKEYPILLLDDVASELDNSRQSNLLASTIEQVQTMIATADDSLLKSFKINPDIKLIKVENGNTL